MLWFAAYIEGWENMMKSVSDLILKSEPVREQEGEIGPWIYGTENWFVFFIKIQERFSTPCYLFARI